MTNETAAWLEELKKNGGIGDDDFAVIKRSVESNTKADEHIRGSVLRQSDYSRQSAEVQAAKTAAETALRGVADKEAALNKFQGELGTWKSQAEGSFQKALADKEAADNRAQKALARLSTVQSKYGIPDEDVKLDDVVIEKKEPVAGPKYTTEEDLKRIVGSGMQEAGILDAMIYDLGAEHQRLFGTPLPKAANLVKEALAAGSNPATGRPYTLTEFWSDKYKVADREKALGEEAYQTRLKTDVEAELAKRLSSANLPGGVQPGNLRPDLPQSPVFSKKLELPASEGQGIAAAIAAFNAGKHRVK